MPVGWMTLCWSDLAWISPQLTCPSGKTWCVGSSVRGKAASKSAWWANTWILVDAYKSLNEALDHAGLQTDTQVDIEYIDAEIIETQGVGVLQHLDAILVPGGFGDRGIQGKIEAVRYAREHDIPFLGICLGMHMAMIEYARNVCGLEQAHSTEMNRETPHPIIALITEWQTAEGDENSVPRPPI